LEVKLGHYAVEEVANGSVSIDRGARPARTMTTAACRPAHAATPTNMAVPHDL
jgi:hypothetical protein